MARFFLPLVASLLAAIAIAHPGHGGTTEMKSRAAYLSSLERTSLAPCASQLEASGHASKIIARREAEVAQLRQKRGLDLKHYLKARQTPGMGLSGMLGMSAVGPAPEALNQSHVSDQSYSTETPNWTLFGDNQTVILSPEVTEGPFYVSGETIRKDVREGQKGIDLHMDIQMMDINSCTPVPDAAVDFWHANATGVYGGVVSPINGNVNDTSNLQNKMLRGIQVSDQDGVVEFTSIFPGHYGGRAVHVHILAQLNATRLANKTVTGGTTAHVGQLYFDMDLIHEVRKVEPYLGNQQELVENDKDMLLRMSAANGADPLVEYTLLGPSISDGIFAWINFRVNGTNVRTAHAAVECGEGGCVANPGKGSFGGFGKEIAPPKRHCESSNSGT